MIVIYLSNYKSGWWAELLGTSGKEIELVFSAELELGTSGLHLRCTQRLAMLPASLALHVRQQTKQKKILKNEKFLRLSYIRKVISSFGNIMINRCHSRDPAQVIHVHNPPWDQCLHYRVSWFLLFSCLFCLFVWGQAVIRSGQYHLLRVAEKWQKIIVKKFQQIFVGLLDSSLFFLNCCEPSMRVPSFIIVLSFTVRSFECQTSRRANKSNTAWTGVVWGFHCITVGVILFH